MGIIFEVITENKSSIIEVLIEILKQAEKKGDYSCIFKKRLEKLIKEN